MIRLLIWALLIYIGYRIIISMTGTRKRQDNLSRDRTAAEVIHRDPVCGVYVSEQDAVVGTHEGQRHYFCSRACLEKYREQLDH